MKPEPQSSAGSPAHETLDGGDPKVDSPDSIEHPEIAIILDLRASEGAALEASPEYPELMTFVEFEAAFKWKLKEWKGLPFQIELEDGRSVRLVRFDYNGQEYDYDDVTLFPAASENSFWDHPMDFFDPKKKYPKKRDSDKEVVGVVIGIYTETKAHGLPHKRIVFIPAE